ncbi:VOC family protein [Brevundimonas sp.]|jgi:catechol 2,3-dioxygenase-like lactoylglutathione lyase family enzyme|uniref:VOC family protein n=1 Tax=Brevundimonas sp. TaxID=1871086 RepID=UPI0037BF9269
MLGDHDSSAIVAVRDIDRARAFYRDVLGLTLEDEGEGRALTFRTGATRLIVYPSDHAGTNQANAVVFTMKGDLAETVQTLKTRGVAFEHYDLPGLTLNGDMHEAGPVKLVWFKDPDGNLIHLLEGM